MNGSRASRLAATWAHDERPWQLLDGSAVLADLSGFTRLTEVLTGTGAEGVEVLHRALTTCFGALLGRSLELDGDVVGFAGDAALVWFDGDDHATRAALAAASMPTRLADIPASMTGRTRLRASVGVHTGRYLAVSTGAADRPGPFLCGPEMSMLARLEAAAAPMQVLMSAATADLLPRTWCGEQAEPGIELDRRRARRPGTGSAGPTRSVDATIESTGEHRDASAAFLPVPGIDDLLAADGPDAVHRHLAHVVDVATRVADDHALEWLDCDVGVNSVKLLFTAGATRALGDDDARLLSGMRRIVDECTVPVRAGAQRGRTFSGYLGVQGRQTYTVLGDPVNVAARALSRARDGELIVGDGFDLTAHPWVTAEPIGPQQLKNRARPMDMWRVASVTDRPFTRPRLPTSLATSCRRDEWDLLVTGWKTTVDGTGTSIDIVGDAGMGSSELVADLADLAGGNATPIVVDRFRRHVAYAGVATLVRTLALGAGSDPGDGGWAWLRAFVPRLPEPLRSWADVALAVAAGAPVGPQDPLTVARRTRQVLVALLAEAAPTPWLVVIEGADQLDDTSRQVIDELRATTITTRTMIVTTAERALERGPTDHTVTIALDPLDDESARAFLITLAPDLRDVQLDRIIAAGGGNPFVMAEIVNRPDIDALPDSLARLGTTLLDSLPPAVRADVLDASVFGMDLEPALIAAVLHRSELASEEHWHAADRVLRRGDGAAWRFRHEAYRRAAYETLTFRRRRELHGSIADHLLGSAAADGALTALHLEAAGRHHEAYPIAVRAARAAKSAGALAESVDLFERATSMSRQIDPRSHGRLLLELGETRLWTGDVDGASAAYTAAARRLDDPLDHAQLCHLRASLALSRHRLRPARTWISKGLDLATPFADRATEVHINLLLHEAIRLDLGYRRTEALVPAREALAMAEIAGLPALAAQAHMQLECILSVMFDPAAIAHGDSAIAAFEALGDDRHLSRALVNAGLTSMYLGHWDQAIERYERSRAHALRCGDTNDVAVCDLNLGFVRYRRREFAEAEALARRAGRTLHAVKWESAAATSTLLRAMVASSTGDHELADELTTEARDTFVRLEDTAMVLDCEITRLEHLARRGEHQSVVREAARLAPRVGAAEAEAAITFDRVLGCSRLATGDPDGIELVERALRTAREHQLVYEVFLALSALADITDDPTTRDERDALARSLGITMH